MKVGTGLSKEGDPLPCSHLKPVKGELSAGSSGPGYLECAEVLHKCGGKKHMTVSQITPSLHGHTRRPVN